MTAASANPRAHKIAAALCCVLLQSTPAGAERAALDRCLEEQDLPRVARVRSPQGGARFVRVVEAVEGVPTRGVPIDGDLGSLTEVLARASGTPRDARAAWEIAPAAAATEVCAPFALAQAEIDAEERVVVAVGLNYAAHAEEAGGGDVFLFPKPVAPTPPYGAVVRPDQVTLLDYEVELAFVVLGDLDLRALPSREALLAQTAFFVVNEVTDREPIIRSKALVGPGTGFVEGKGQPGFLPAGPWLVRGSELFAALSACGADGLGLQLDVDEGEGFRPRQDASTTRMILDLDALLARIAEEVEREGLRTAMPLARDGETRHYPLAVDAASPRLPAGSVVLTGTPEGVAMRTPDALGLVMRGLAHLRGPFEQFRQEELARAAAGGPGGYLEPGDRVRAAIDGLGAQIVRITDSAGLNPDPCGGVTLASPNVR